MNAAEIFPILLNKPINRVIIRNKENDLPSYCSSKGGRYWFDCDFVSEDEILALIGYALIQEKGLIPIDDPFENPNHFNLALIGYALIQEKGLIPIDDPFENPNHFKLVIHFDKATTIVLPNLTKEKAEAIYNDRANGYCNFNTVKIDKNKISAELGSELCIDELVAIYYLLQDIKKKVT